MNEIVIEQKIAASSATVYQYLTKAEKWSRWQGASARLDARPGGIFSLVMGNGMNARGQFVELVADKRVVFTWGWTDQPGIPPGSTTVEIDLENDGDDTLLVLTHRSVPAEEASKQRAGWSHYLPRLALVASGNDPGADVGPGN